jgi:hypothetical protein
MEQIEPLVLSKQATENMRRQARNAMRSVRPALPVVAQRRLALRPEWLEGGRWAPTNPSCVLVPGRDLAIVSYRLVNYRNTRASYYRFMDADGVIRTRVVLQLRQLDGTVVAEALLEPPATDVAGPYQGLEDARLFWDGDVLCFSASYAQLRPVAVPRVVYGRTGVRADTLWKDGDVLTCSVTELSVSHMYQTEKNWLPFGSLQWIYSLDPFVVVTYAEGTATASAPRPHPLDLGPLRGSTGPVRVDGVWLSLYHYYSEGDGRWYHHRWVLHDDTMAPVAVSETFCFDAEPAKAEVEFACGLAVLPSGHLWVTYGKNDCEAWEVEVDLTTVFTMRWYKN